MAKTLAVTVVLALLASTAAAQTRTECRQEGSTVVCQARDNSNGGIFGWVAYGQYRALQKKVGALVAAGDCAGARKLALEAGNFTLAKQADDTCKPSQATTPAN